MSKKDLEEQIVKRLDAIIALMLEPKSADMTIKGKVELLCNIGLGYKQIASILNKKPNNIGVMMNSLKKKK